MSKRQKGLKKSIVWGLCFSMVLTLVNLFMISTAAKASGEGVKLKYGILSEKDKTARVLGTDSNDPEGELVIPSTVIIDGTEYTVTEIAFGAFENCKKLTGELVIPDSVTVISNMAFYECTGLTGDLTIPDSVTTIEMDAFYNCRGFNGKLTLGENVEKIGYAAFYNCSGFQGTLTIPNSMKKIEPSAFQGCGGFTGSLVIPNSVTTLGRSAFSGCAGFDGTLTIPNGLTQIDSFVFNNCKGFNGELIIPDSITAIGDWTFFGCNNLTGELIIPDGVTKIGKYAFAGCSGLTDNLIIPSGVASIGSCAFNDCSNLQQVYFEGKVTGLDHTFDQCNLSKCYIPCSMESEKDNLSVNEECIQIYHDNSIEEYKSNATHHWNECISCGIKINVAPHLDEDSDAICDVCANEIHNHDGQKVEQVDATCYSYGVKAYYSCSCGKSFIDSACISEITDLEAWKNGKGRIDKKDHSYETTTIKATTSANGKKETKCAACGKVKSTIIIYAAKNINLSKATYTYDGKAKKPTVTVKDSKGKVIAGTNYSIKYDDGRKNVGKYNVKITFKGDYKGSKTLTFTIIPKATTLKSVASASKAFTANWSKQTTQVDGYEVEYALDQKFTSSAKKVAVTQNTTTSKKISGLKSKKTYYVRVHTYKKVGTKKYYSDWSKVLSVKTK